MKQNQSDFIVYFLSIRCIPVCLSETLPCFISVRTTNHLCITVSTWFILLLPRLCSFDKKMGLWLLPLEDLELILFLVYQFRNLSIKFFFLITTTTKKKQYGFRNIHQLFIWYISDIGFVINLSYFQGRPYWLIWYF